jgi:transcription elongation factor GreA
MEPAQRLTERLAELRAERALIEADLLTPSGGDDADRATNVDAHVHLAALDERIATAEATLGAASVARPANGVIAVGSVVGLDFGDGTETFVVGGDLGDPALSVVTPGSPLGRALLGATTGTQITYTARPGRPVSVTVTSVQ